MKPNLPTLLTWFRIALIPLFIAVLYIPDSGLSAGTKAWTAAGIFAIACLTDALDGYLARKLNQTTAFGAFLDPVADKLMVAAALIMLVHLQQASPLAAFIIVGREITISALREWMAQLGKSQSVAVSLLGKIKTTCQMLAILILLIGEAGLPHTPILIIGQTVLWTAALLTLWSMIYYCKIAYPFLKNPHKSS